MDKNIVPELEHIGVVQTQASLWRLLRRYYRARGFEGLAYFVANRNNGRTIRGFTVVHRGFSKAVADAYIRDGWGEKDPGPAYALLHGTPMRWKSIYDRLGASTEQAAFVEKMQSVGLGDGYVLPVYGPQGRHGAVAIGNPVSPQAIDEAPLDAMHLIAQAAHMQLCQLLPDRLSLEKPLSGRELQILEWVARGKSNGVIADILQLSAATVDTYLRRIFDKLEVSDRTSAAVRGVGMGLIAA